MASTTPKDPSLHSGVISDFPTVISKANKIESINWKSQEECKGISWKSWNKLVKKSGLKTFLCVLSNKVVFGRGVVCSFWSMMELLTCSHSVAKLNYD